MSGRAHDERPIRIDPDRTVHDLLADRGGPSEIFASRPPISVDTLFESLAEPGRRYVLTYLLMVEESVSTTELVDYVVQRTDDGASRDRMRKAIASEMVHRHLPQLADAGLVEYNLERQLVGPTVRTEAALPYLSLAVEQVREAEAAEE